MRRDTSDALGAVVMRRRAGGGPGAAARGGGQGVRRAAARTQQGVGAGAASFSAPAAPRVVSCARRGSCPLARRGSCAASLPPPRRVSRRPPRLGSLLCLAAGWGGRVSRSVAHLSCVTALWCIRITPRWLACRVSRLPVTQLPGLSSRSDSCIAATVTRAAVTRAAVTRASQLAWTYGSSTAAAWYPSA